MWEEAPFAMLRKASPILLTAFLIAILGAAFITHRMTSNANAIRGSIDLNEVLSWFPADTETLLAADGPFWMSNFQLADNESRNTQVTEGELAKEFEGMTLELFNAKNYFLERHLEGKKVLFAIEGSRHFRPPKGLGEMTFEGCAVAIFKDNLRDTRMAFMRDAASVASRIEEVEGLKVAVFKEQSEEDILTTFVTFPQDGVVLVATNEQFLQQTLTRMRDAGVKNERALPDNLPEWKYVNKEAKFWGLRHYDKQQASKDPTSPFGGMKSANIPDDEAIGLTYDCDPTKAQEATITYISGLNTDLQKIEKKRFSIDSDPKAIAGLHIQYEEIAPGTMQSKYDLRYSQPVSFFLFILTGDFGHAVYL
jgi:hypothetical protein